MISFKELLGLGYYTSELDQFLSKFNETHPDLSASQQNEIKKHDRIVTLRDNIQNSF